MHEQHTWEPILSNSREWHSFHNQCILDAKLDLSLRNQAEIMEALKRIELAQPRRVENRLQEIEEMMGLNGTGVPDEELHK